MSCFTLNSMLLNAKVQRKEYHRKHTESFSALETHTKKNLNSITISKVNCRGTIFSDISLYLSSFLSFSITLQIYL